MAQSDSEPTYYDILGIKSDFPSEAIDGLRRSFSRLYHPDTDTDDARKMAQINNACDVLRDPQKRKEYDAELRAKATTSRPREPSGERAHGAQRQPSPKPPPPPQPPPSSTPKRPQPADSSPSPVTPQATQADFPPGYKGKLIFRGIFSLVWWFIFADGFGGLTYLNDPWAYIPAGVAVVMLIARK